MDPWIVVNTHIYKEAMAQNNLERQGFIIYCPMIRKSIRHARQTQDVLRPLFPSYLFVHFRSNLMQHWRPMMSTHGVRSVIQCGDRPSLLDNAFIEGLKAREVEGVITRPAASYEIGQKVRIEGGPFDGILATIIELSEKDRLIVLMDLLKRSVRVRIDAQSVVAI